VKRVITAVVATACIAFSAGCDPAVESVTPPSGDVATTTTTSGDASAGTRLPGTKTAAGDRNDATDGSGSDAAAVDAPLDSVDTLLDQVDRQVDDAGRTPKDPDR
jgi:hypothetical protein